MIEITKDIVIFAYSTS